MLSQQPAQWEHTAVWGRLRARTARAATTVQQPAYLSQHALESAQLAPTPLLEPVHVHPVLQDTMHPERHRQHVQPVQRAGIVRQLASLRVPALDRVQLAPMQQQDLVSVHRALRERMLRQWRLFAHHASTGSTLLPA
jgi:hypothetical protein